MSVLFHVLAGVLPNAPTVEQQYAIGAARGWPVGASCLTPVLLEPIPGTDEYYVRWGFVVTVRYADGTTRSLTIQDGFRTDLGTIPRVFRSISRLSPSRWALSYVAHDHIFILRKYDDGTPIGLAEADWVLLLLMSFQQAPRKEQTVIYRGLQFGSWYVWRTGEGSKGIHHDSEI